MSARVEVSGLRFTYPDGRVALREVDLVVDPGERLAILGPNGAGKTTLALHLNGILAADKGQVTIGQTAVVEEDYPLVRRMVGLVFQDSNDQLFMPTVREDVAFGPANLGKKDVELHAAVDTALAIVDGAGFADRPPHHLSGGEKRRAALATVLSMDPDVLVFDEPSAGLDPSGRRELVATLTELPMTQLIITHDLPLALELCPRAVVMNDGRVVADGTTREILTDSDLLESNRLELPYGFSLTPPPA
jgi:cobalt/nickel transport system ATP-binding protein